jgi:sigma-B regulation protein RsbU (phosphoserine phosphatase)
MTLGTAEAETTATVACARVRSGNGRIDVPIGLPGMRGVLHSRPSDGGRGGDVYSLSVCGSGLLTRICVADLVGHGARVGELGERVHGLLQRFVNRPDHRRILRELNDGLVALGIDAMTTAAIFTYYPPSRRLSFTYAGHPPAWFFRRRTSRWTRLAADTPDAPSADAADLVDGVLGVSPSVGFTRSSVEVERGDRLLLLTDGVLETPSPSGEQFGRDRLERELNARAESPVGRQAEEVLAALGRYHERATLDHDDVTIMLLEFVGGPAGPALWHVVRNRVLRPLRLVRTR